MSRRSHKNKKYSEEFRIQAVEAYLRGEGSQREICKKFGILDKRQLHNWIMWHNGHREIKRKNTAKGEIYMTKGRTTTQEERAEIVAFCILKSEMYYLRKFTDRAELIQAIENYIPFYNTKRYQFKLRCMTPMEFHAAFAA